MRATSRRSRVGSTASTLTLLQLPLQRSLCAAACCSTLLCAAAASLACGQAGCCCCFLEQAQPPS
jgi:hypothetical protein